MFEQRDAIRAEFAAPVLKGTGLEIGAGAYPQTLPLGVSARYFDIRTSEEAVKLFGKEVVDTYPMAEVTRFFPNGADFLIAHNVLEHIPDPIGGLIAWNSLVRIGGSVVISLPHRDYCPDGLRIRTEYRHILGDFLMHSDGSDPGSREHIIAFATSWHEDFCRTNGLEKIEDFTRSVLKIYPTANDAHWHSLDTELSLQIVAGAAEFGGTRIKDLRCWSPERSETIGDILISYSVDARREPAQYVRRLINLTERRERAVSRALRRIDSRVLELRHPKSSLLRRAAQRGYAALRKRLNA
jgi:SAM-dependent methyltransferase